MTGMGSRFHKRMPLGTCIANVCALSIVLSVLAETPPDTSKDILDVVKALSDSKTLSSVTEKLGGKSPAAPGWTSLLDALRATPVTPQELSAESVEFFETKVRPVLVDNCFQCHGPDKQKN